MGLCLSTKSGSSLSGVDTNFLPPLVPVIFSAASIIAKVTRDRIMRELDEQFPDYGFAKHKGYITKVHTESLQEHGPCIEHRRSFANIAALL